MKNVNLRLKVLLLLSSITFFICFFPFKQTNVDLVPYVEDYKRLLNNHCSKPIKIPNQFFVNFGDLPKEWAGVCNGGTLFYGKVTIDRLYWKGLSEDSRYELIFHELSHCILGLDHTDDSNNYMYYSIRLIKKEELFDQVKKSIEDYCEKI